MLSRIEHIALAVFDLEDAVRHHRDVLGLRLSHREVVQDQGVEEAMFAIGDCFIQLLGALSPDTVIGRFLDSKGAGLHHIAYEVQDIEAALAELSTRGVRLIDKKPRAGSRGTRIAFVSPGGGGGMLTELVEKPKSASSPPGR